MRSALAAVLMLVGMAGAVAEPAAVTSDIPYGDLARQKLDLYVPADAAGNAPALIFFYGGGWQEGAKANMRDTAMSLTEAGMIVVMPDYRLYPQAVFPEFVEDCALAVARARTLIAGLGGHHPIFIGGHSAGAFNAGMLAADERYLAAAGVPADAVAGYVLLSGPYNMSGYVPTPFARVFPVAERHRANANAFIDGSEPPLLLVTADVDTMVDPVLARQLADRVKAKGGRVTVLTIDGGSDGHLATFLGVGEPGSAVRRGMATFMAEVMEE